jgi:hypothetical protein
MRFVSSTDEVTENFQDEPVANPDDGEEQPATQETVDVEIKTLHDEQEDPDDESGAKNLAGSQDSAGVDTTPIKKIPKSYLRSYQDRHVIEWAKQPIEATHLMKYLKVFCKATPLSQSVFVFFQEGEPLVLSYDIRGIGTLLYCICDVSEKTNENVDDAGM